VPTNVFISDIHLDPTSPELTFALEGFLRRHSRCTALYILGDLFEVWVGDDDDADLARHVAGVLRNFSDAGPIVYLMQGNRDFLLGQDFCSKAGAILLSDPTVIDLYGTPTLLMHGDSLCIGDTHYQTFRRQVRMPRWRAEMLGRGLNERRELAAKLRVVSRESISNKAEDIMDVSITEVTRVMAEHGVKRMIHGHTHRPACHALVDGERWVLGDWSERGWAIEASRSGLLLYDFNRAFINLIQRHSLPVRGSRTNASQQSRTFQRGGTPLWNRNSSSRSSISDFSYTSSSDRRSSISSRVVTSCANSRYSIKCRASDCNRDR
jgi:UDP-2,3-diacylglucosamine hydrolase